MNTLEQVRKTGLQLPDEQQPMLIKILQNRFHESCHTKMAADARQTLAVSMQANFNTSQPINKNFIFKF